MSLTLNIDLSDEDLERFTGQIEAARKDAGSKSNDEIVAAATVLLEKAQQGNPPQFVKQRLPALGTLIAMLRDEALGAVGGGLPARAWRPELPRGARSTSFPTTSRCSASSTTRS